MKDFRSRSGHPLVDRNNINCGHPSILLFGFVGDENEQSTQGISFSLLDYIELVDWSGRIIREDKRGVISSQRPRLLSTLGLDDDTWLLLASSFGKDYRGAVGSLEALAAYASNTGKRWVASKNQLRLH
ncbi:hypothetical protein [Psychromonas algicola]|uniref:hypothetical protein n=1 Tax=Psychromonas algicola TaxID=2555642 RepID=UPI001068488F|nr:hypothetical protein [Psychromonas sp. RZ5]TEW51919.1 hypothetical protein E2R67_05390 [Psychromonas sp. RZ5]